ncbi:hypothetical protein [Desnuesiella massiliensis]|uniref:hypothetical protein n=1 Tax=Desnuesiella massiliensis TaxID=1650662 RepID=UPI0006E2357D|nr:hypothetical protein [Desnuesiella massiliensis]
MIDNLRKWVRKEKNNLILGVFFIVVMLISVSLERKFNIYYKFLYAFSFTIIVIYILLNYKINYSKNKRINGFLVFILNIIIMLDLYRYTRASVIDWFLCIEVLLYLVVVSVGVHMVYIAKKEFRKNFIKYLLLSIFTVVISFAGIYLSLYDMYFPYGYENFKIDQKMNYSRVVMPTDFIYYSADCFFGRSVSYVKISTPDYTDVQDDKKVAHNYPEMYHNVELVYTAVRIFSMLEAILFVVYISIIVVIMPSKDDEEIEKTTKKKQNEMYEKIIKIDSDIEGLKNMVRNYDFRPKGSKGLEPLKKLIQYFLN